MLALFANVLMLLPVLTVLGAVLALVPPWLGTVILLPLVTIALIVIPAYLIIGAIHAAATAGRDLRRGIAKAEADYGAALAEIAARHGAPAPHRRTRLGAPY